SSRMSPSTTGCLGSSVDSQARAHAMLSAGQADAKRRRANRGRTADIARYTYSPPGPNPRASVSSAGKPAWLEKVNATCRTSQRSVFVPLEALTNCRAVLEFSRVDASDRAVTSIAAGHSCRDERGPEERCIDLAFRDRSCATNGLDRKSTRLNSSH